VIRRRPRVADLEQEPGLEAFGRELRGRVHEGFDPSPATVARIETDVVTAFRAIWAGSELDARHRPSLAARTRARWRWPVLPLVAALALASTGAVVAAQTSPGRPLFGARVAIEDVLLPGASSAARIDAQLVRLLRRVTEARDAGRAADGGAIVAAVRSYRETLTDLGDLARQHPDRAATVRRALHEQIVALEELAQGTAETTRQEIAVALREARAVTASIAPRADGSRGSDGTEGSAWARPDLEAVGASSRWRTR
jgi:hypothetical protein